MCQLGTIKWQTLTKQEIKVFSGITFGDNRKVKKFYGRRNELQKMSLRSFHKCHFFVNRNAHLISWVLPLKPNQKKLVSIFEKISCKTVQLILVILLNVIMQTEYVLMQLIEEQEFDSTNKQEMGKSSDSKSIARLR